MESGGSRLRTDGRGIERKNPPAPFLASAPVLRTAVTAFILQRWAKKWNCFAKHQPGRVRQKLLAT